MRTIRYASEIVSTTSPVVTFTRQEVRSVSHPLEPRHRRVEAERCPVGVIISGRQKQRRQYRADRPAPVRPAAWIRKRRQVHAIERAAVPVELMPGDRQTARMRGRRNPGRGATKPGCGPRCG